MKLVLKIIGYLLIALLLVVISAMCYLKFALPNVGDAPDIKIEQSAERIARGKYLANHITLCMDCHSSRNWELFSGPLEEGTLGMGGEVFAQEMGFPGRYVSANITPAKLGSWTDGEIYRAVTSGVSKDGRALFSIMPHHNFGQMDKEDIYSIISYIRTLSPIEYEPEPSSSDFPMNFIINTIPQPAKHQTRPSQDNLLAYGKYLVTAASCNDCHTKQEKGKFIGEKFAGGMEFPLPGGKLVRSANITPSPSGIGAWTERQFIARFKQYSDSSYTSPAIGPRDFQTIMPWAMYAGMDSTDLRAIFRYLQSIEPKDNVVSLFEIHQN